MTNATHEAVLFLALTFAAALVFSTCVAAAVLVARLPASGVPFISPGVSHGVQASVKAKR